MTLLDQPQERPYMAPRRCPRIDEGSPHEAHSVHFRVGTGWVEYRCSGLHEDPPPLPPRR